MKKIIALCMPILLAACGSDDSSSTPTPEPKPTPVLSSDKCYLFDTTLGEFEVAIDETNTPITGKNFTSYADEGFYDGVIFHRVVHNFVNQTGGFTSGLVHKEGKSPIKNEASVGFSNVRGTLSMARTSNPDSGTSQFFINVLDNTNLDYSASFPGHAVFGKVTSGMDVVDQINIADVHNVSGFGDVPVTDIVINQVVEQQCP